MNLYQDVIGDDSWRRSRAPGRYVRESRQGIIPMRIIVFLSLAVVLGSSTGARSDIVEFDLPELTGPSDTLRTTMLEYDYSEGSISYSYFRVTGVVSSLGKLECLDAPAMPDTMSWPMRMFGEVEKPSQWWFHLSGSNRVDEVGGFSVIVELISKRESLSISTGDTLRVDFIFEPTVVFPPCTPITPATRGLITGVTLVIDVRPWTPAQSSTWGRIKSNYRAHN